ncbi:hypothetical protein, partial [Campylobacter rectus]|uniref:hypothetical protein n=1 Tax=Campylobacter rectus TaxID=203 RepID=UPI000586BE84
MPLNFELRKNCLSERPPPFFLSELQINKISNAFLRKQKIFACKLATANRPKRSEQKELLDEKNNYSIFSCAFGNPC